MAFEKGVGLGRADYARIEGLAYLRGRKVHGGGVAERARVANDVVSAGADARCAGLQLLHSAKQALQ